ncbi:MAG: metal-dependent hydrolase [Abitibacteriaceae bacterium]|nr:metal-dependent hydrolase [Abditibacteriaceae bacterium]MBV9865358.1 metal-dependent hydrolase [Abditibacteriaceae bacterium]
MKRVASIQGSLPMSDSHQQSPAPTGADPSGLLRQQLHQRLLKLHFQAFAQIVKQALEQSGYCNVHMAGRRHRRTRTAHGGLDLRAYSHTDLTSALTIVQVKQYQRPVSRRFIDELRGTMLRVGARHGVLITTSHFSTVAERAAAQDDIAPIKLVTGEMLLDLLLTHKIGVRDDGKAQSVVDEDFFTQLGRESLSPKATVSEQTSVATVTDAAYPIRNRATACGASGGEMTWTTHVLFGINTLWVVEAWPKGIDPTNIGLVVAAAALGSLLPDLDAAESKLKHLNLVGVKPFFWPSQVIHRQLGHRGLSHSLVGLLLVTLIAVPLVAWWGWPPSLALVLGYASHLIADACTKSGIPFWYPRKYRYHLLPAGWRFTTGSQAEEMLFPFLVMAVLLLLLRHLPANQSIY